MNTRDDELGKNSRRSLLLKDLETMIQADPERAPGHRPTVAVVDDDVSVRDSLQTILQDKYDVRTCPSGVEAVRTIDGDTSCVILLGIEATSQAKPRHSHHLPFGISRSQRPVPNH